MQWRRRDANRREPPISSEEILTQTQKLFESKEFSQSAILQNLLRHIVQECIAGNIPSAALLFELVYVGRERKQALAGGAPKHDEENRVRVDAGRLRMKLLAYYKNEGSSDPIVIEIPKGAYRATFSRTTRGTSSPRTNEKFPLAWIVAAVFGALVLGYFLSLVLQRRLPEKISLAVLSFESGDAESDGGLFGEGMTDALINRLSAVE